MAIPIIIYAVAIALGTAGAAAIAYYWPSIINWLSNKIAPWIGENIGDKEKDAFLEVIAFLDNKVTAVRRGVKGIVSKSIHLIRSLFIKQGDSYIRKDETYLSNPKNHEKVTVQTRTEEVDWDDIPDSVRAGFIRETKEEKTINWLDKDVLINVNEV